MKTTWTICIATMLAACLLAGGCNSVEEKNRQADKTAEIVLKLLAADKTDSLYLNYTTEGFREANSENTLRKLAKVLNMYLGEPESHSLLKYDLKLTNTAAAGQYVYKVRWAKADGLLLLKLYWQDGACKIQTMDIQSDALLGGRKPAAQSAPPTQPTQSQPTQPTNSQPTQPSQPTRPVNTGKTIHI